MARFLSPVLASAPVAGLAKDQSAVIEIDLSTEFESKTEDVETRAFHALSAGSNGDLIDLDATHLISSPYPDFENQLRLDGLDLPYRLFAFALSALKPIREDYATAPYMESFNWPEVFALLRNLCRKAGLEWQQREFYVVIFRSKLQENIDRARLGLLDQKSHQEACASGGLLKYWFGSPDEESRNLATCEWKLPDRNSSTKWLTSYLGLWRNHDDAVAGGSGPWHKQARGAARVM